MFENFCKQFGVEIRSDVPCEDHEAFQSVDMAMEFMLNFKGRTFGDGVYRVHHLQDVPKWNSIVCEAFPHLSGQIQCFGFDWLGRQFAIDYRRTEEGEPMVLLIEPGTGELLEIPCSFQTFHEEELVEYQDAALAVDAFTEWRKSATEELQHHQCVGYKVPLFLGGEDELNNMEVSDMEVYWGMMAQLING